MADADKKRKILVADDDETQLTTIDAMLGGEYEIYTAKSGKEALECFTRGFVPDLVLLDILMPEMDGWEVFHKIRGISVLRQVPIMFFSSLTSGGEENRAFEMGAADFIKKPYEKNDLVARIEKALSRSHNADFPKI